ncbi:MAG: CopG family transcriptional regulator [Acidithiobacillus sp.]|uniref:ribbon-helix-helix domain-containing protein n=1 Tax=Acidithiobacillus sp. TaxID=1872118 RepID=UPI002583081A|nr:CopG family transcriptional regulator [Acidithiobacillus sp.]MCE5421158.1 CopG family transcriptional regulator [Acidithiobacillus sp.]
MQRTTVFLPESQRKQLDMLARATGMPGSEHIRRALDQYFTTAEVRYALDLAAREATRRDAGVPLPTIENVENTVMFRFLDEDKKQRIRTAATDMEKRQLMDAFLSEVA